MYRRTVSLTLFLSGVLELVTSIVLYIQPHGRVAYWANWTFFGLSKDQWDALHVNLGFLFLIAGVLHVVLNWKPVVKYMKNQARRLVVLTRPMVVSLVLTLVVALGTLWHLPPMQQVLDLAGAIKEHHAQTYGNPPFGHAELATVQKVARYTGIDPQAAVAALREQGIALDSGAEVLKDVAERNGRTPAAVYEIMATARTGNAALPEMPPEGTGQMRLADFASQWGLDPAKAVSRLAARSIQAQPDQTFKEIAQANNLSPVDVYQALR